MMISKAHGLFDESFCMQWISNKGHMRHDIKRAVCHQNPSSLVVLTATVFLDIQNNTEKHMFPST